VATSPIRTALNKALLDNNVANADGQIILPLTTLDLEETIRRVKARGGTVTLAAKADVIAVDKLVHIDATASSTLTIMALSPGVTGLTVTIVLNGSDNLSITASGTDITIHLANATATKNAVKTVASAINNSDALGAGVAPVLHASVTAGTGNLSELLAKTALAGGGAYNLLDIRPQ
jgi:hypothetical protein